MPNTSGDAVPSTDGGSSEVRLNMWPTSTPTWAAKRGLDVGVAVTALFLLLPLLLLIALIVWAGDGKPPIYRHMRIGRDGRRFGCLKFRSMVVDGDAVLAAHLSANPQARAEWAASHKLTDDPRITPIGQVLRKTSLDELPQLWNVLRGAMSLVGPRPHALAHDNYYDQVISKYVYRHHMKPGLTGWAQANGFRGETPTIDLMEKRVEYDVWYVSNWSIWLDIRIIFQTAVALMYQEAY
jgi:exopolysaccharide biosynthesis polyprenyl glycosylphosphotransferase